MVVPGSEMITIRERIGTREPAGASLTLGWDQRQKSRFRCRLEDGREVAVMLSREGVLRQGDCLRADSGLIVEVVAAQEELMEARTNDPLLFARAAYHMGNRHVPLEVRTDCMRFKPDHVLEEMLRRLGMELQICRSAFEPESGAYGGHSHAHSHEVEGDSEDEVGVGRGPRIHFMQRDVESGEPL